MHAIVIKENGSFGLGTLLRVDEISDPEQSARVFEAHSGEPGLLTLDVLLVSSNVALLKALSTMFFTGLFITETKDFVQSLKLERLAAIEQTMKGAQAAIVAEVGREVIKRLNETKSYVASMGCKVNLQYFGVESC